MTSNTPRDPAASDLAAGSARAAADSGSAASGSAASGSPSALSLPDRGCEPEADGDRGPDRASSSARLRRRLAWWAVIACAPYLTLKLLWIAGIDVGVVDTDKIDRGKWIAANLLTFVMDAIAAAIAHHLTRPKVGRGRAWLMLPPLWVASGLLGVIMLAVPLGLLGALLGDGGNPFGGDDFLHGWVYGVVYGGFIVEGTVLVGAFVLYAHERWGSFLRTSVARLARFSGRADRVLRVAGGVVAVALVFTGALRVAWAAGSDLGMSVAWGDDRDAAARSLDLTQGTLALVGAAGVLALVFRLGRSRVRVPLAAAWIGTAATGAFGGWIGLATAFASPGSEAANRTSALLHIVYTAEMITGLLAFAAGWYFLSRSVARTASPAVPAAAPGSAPRIPAA